MLQYKRTKSILKKIILTYDKSDRLAKKKTHKKH